MNLKKLVSYYLLIYFVLFFFFVALAFNITITKEQQFSYLAQSFLQGKLYFLEQPGSWGDAVYYQGHYYWPPAPFSAVLLMPFVSLFGLFGKFFYQGYLQPFLVLSVFFLWYKLAQKFKHSLSDSLYLAFAFCFSSVFLGVAFWPWSWFFTQVVYTLLLVLALYEYVNKKRYWLIGLLVGLIGATRPEGFLVAIFFVLEIVFVVKEPFRQKIIYLTKFSFGPVLSIALLAGYNFARFGNPFEQGYGAQILPDFIDKSRSYGLFSLVHLPRNLYQLFLGLPLPVYRDISHNLVFPFIKANPWGMSLFLTNTYLLYLLSLKYKDAVSKIILVVVLIILLLILFCYSIGFRQYGYRYALDFLPFLNFLLIRNYHLGRPVLSARFKTLILLSAFLNLYLFLTMFIGWGE